MSPRELLVQLREKGVEIKSNGDRLLVDAPKGAITPDLRDALVESEPLREHLRAQQITALYRAGRQADALRATEALRTALLAFNSFDEQETARHRQRMRVILETAALQAYSMTSSPR